MPAGATTSIQETTERLATEASGSVVGLRGGAHRGSGVVVGRDRVLTLARNLRRGEATVVLEDASESPGRILGVDSELRVGLVEVPTGGRPPAPWAEGAAAPPIGTPVFALADPGGRGLRVTAGAVASLPRSIRGPWGRPIEGLIEHTAPLPRGSGGGPLLDAEGRLLGINALRVDEGLILALPAAAIRERLEDLAAGRPRARRQLGVAVVPPRAARRLRRAVGLPERDGVLIRTVLRGSPAESAGLESGDLIVTVDGAAIDSVDSLLGALEAAPSGTPLRLELVRGEQERALEVDLAAGARRQEG